MIQGARDAARGAVPVGPATGGDLPAHSSSNLMSLDGLPAVIGIVRQAKFDDMREGSGESLGGLPFARRHLGEN
jgi:hypothetical protein